MLGEGLIRFWDSVNFWYMHNTLATTGTTGKDNMSGRLMIMSKEDLLLLLIDHDGLRVSVRCMCLKTA